MSILRRWFRSFRRADEAQDLVEYTLLIAFVALAAAGVLSQTGVSIQGPWATANTTLAAATATPVTPAEPSDHNGHGGHGDHDGRDKN